MGSKEGQQEAISQYPDPEDHVNPAGRGRIFFGLNQHFLGLAMTFQHHRCLVSGSESLLDRQGYLQD